MMNEIGEGQIDGPWLKELGTIVWKGVYESEKGYAKVYQHSIRVLQKGAILRKMEVKATDVRHRGLCVSNPE